MDTFIKDFKNSSYYHNLILTDNIVLLYLGGSHSTNMVTKNSDYDLIVLIADGNSVDMSKQIYLTYKGKKVHWYYRSLDDLLSLKNIHGSDIWTIGSIYFKNITEDLIIYKNQNYSKLINSLLEKRFDISILASYKLYNIHKTKINRILNQNKLSLSDQFKLIHHLCLSACYLTNTMPCRTTLLALKDDTGQELTDFSKQQILKYLKLGIDYVTIFPIDYRKELIKLSNEIYKSI